MRKSKSSWKSLKGLLPTDHVKVIRGEYKGKTGIISYFFRDRSVRIMWAEVVLDTFFKKSVSIPIDCLQIMRSK